MSVKFQLVLAATAVALAACTALPPPPAKLSTVAANGFVYNFRRLIHRSEG
jgi:hypothetical protein